MPSVYVILILFLLYFFPDAQGSFPRFRRDFCFIKPKKFSVNHQRPASYNSTVNHAIPETE
jgi:hypothetical protein